MFQNVCKHRIERRRGNRHIGTSELPELQANVCVEIADDVVAEVPDESFECGTDSSRDEVSRTSYEIATGNHRMQVNERFAVDARHVAGEAGDLQHTGNRCFDVFPAFDIVEGEYGLFEGADAGDEASAQVFLARQLHEAFVHRFAALQHDRESVFDASSLHYV